MSFSISIGNNSPLVLEPFFPNQLERFLLPGSQPLAATGSFGTVLVQQYHGEHFSFRYLVLQLFQKITLQWQEDEQLNIQAVLSQGFSYNRGRTRVTLKPSQYNFVWAPGTITKAHFSGGKIYRLFHSLYAPQLVQKLVPSFARFQQLHIEKQAFYMEKETSEAINNIVVAPYDATARDFYFETRLRDIVFTTLQKGPRKFFKGFTQNTLSAIFLADDLIVNNLDKHFTITEIAEKVGLNTTKLKTDFKKIIGMALFERLHNARMEKARTLLLQTDIPIKVIYEMIGYDHLTSFITAFRRHFGTTPGDLRRTGT
jgi:AraC-like DNA-binding protein